MNDELHSGSSFMLHPSSFLTGGYFTEEGIGASPSTGLHLHTRK